MYLHHFIGIFILFLFKDKCFRIKAFINRHLNNLEGVEKYEETASAALSAQPFEDHKHVLVFLT